MDPKKSDPLYKGLVYNPETKTWDIDPALCQLLRDQAEHVLGAGKAAMLRDAADNLRLDALLQDPLYASIINMTIAINNKTRYQILMDRKKAAEAAKSTTTPSATPNAKT